MKVNEKAKEKTHLMSDLKPGECFRFSDGRGIFMWVRWETGSLTRPLEARFGYVNIETGECYMPNDKHFRPSTINVFPCDIVAEEQ